ncbi:MAG: hypothetical protein A2451_03065 [Bdellovibrionales bacterium RIFOXYC2_FULL_39_8]|nr:MAG: hypothetical protein A2451_03065 [Bdellovibrionales bacterium RIFOXYC2_FULL_39_8]
MAINLNRKRDLKSNVKNSGHAHYFFVFVILIRKTESAGGHFIVPASTIVGHYKNKFVIENAFRHLKSIVDLRPFFVRLDDHVRAHVDICMVHIL